MTERCWIGSASVSASVSVNASVSVRWRLDGRMAFVPEGQADRSQARSAWVATHRGPVPEGQADRSQARSAWVAMHRGPVPEGQADRSQARSAWVAMQRGPVPEGRSKSLSVPQIFVVETEPGMSKRQRIECSCRFRNARSSCGKVRVR
jgi:hypothetical protein